MTLVLTESFFDRIIFEEPRIIGFAKPKSPMILSHNDSVKTGIKSRWDWIP